jgi:hypothetical protein
MPPPRDPAPIDDNDFLALERQFIGRRYTGDTSADNDRVALPVAVSRDAPGATSMSIRSERERRSKTVVMSHYLISQHNPTFAEWFLGGYAQLSTLARGV